MFLRICLFTQIDFLPTRQWGGGGTGEATNGNLTLVLPSPLFWYWHLLQTIGAKICLSAVYPQIYIYQYIFQISFIGFSLKSDKGSLEKSCVFNCPLLVTFLLLLDWDRWLDIFLLASEVSVRTARISLTR